MKGLELARNFYEECRTRLYELLPEVMPLACAGLCGEGSECFGCDDETSRDHDFGAAFCLWLPQDVLARHGRAIAAVLQGLPKTFRGICSDFHDPRNGRRGPQGIEDYYRFFTGLERPPRSWREWLAIPEFQLAAAANGEIFEDNAKIFSEWRDELLAFYPEDVRLKKLAARCMQMGQSGQYNLPRCLARGETAAAFMAAARFAEAAISFAFLANRRYMPFYKWAPRLGRALPVLGAELGEMLDALAEHSPAGENGRRLAGAAEKFCAACAAWLNENGLSDERDAWLWAHGPEVIARVKTPEIAQTDLMRESI